MDRERIMVRGLIEMGKINVLMLLPNLRAANGVASFAMNYFRNVDKEKIHIDFALYADRPSPYYEEIKQAGSKIYVLPNIKNLKEHFRVCKKILSEGHYNIIHDNTLHISIPMMWCAKNAGIPVRILHSHSAQMGETKLKAIRNKLFIPILLGLATDYVACSKVAGENLFGKKHFTVIPNVINAEKYVFNENKREQIRKSMHVEDKFVIGTVGRLAYQKNPFFAMDVVKELLKKVPNAEYWWIGSGTLDNEVRKYVKQQGLENNIKLLGSRNDVIDLYQAMDVFFLPSLFEGLPVTGVEAQALGLPMVVSDTVTDEMVYTDLVEYVSLEQNKNIWVKKITEVIKKANVRDKYSTNLKQSIFTDKNCAEILAKLYLNILTESL